MPSSRKKLRRLAGVYDSVLGGGGSAPALGVRRIDWKMTKTTVNATFIDLDPPVEPILAGDLLITIVGNDVNSGAGIFSMPGDWNKMGESGDGLCDCYIAAFWKIADGTEGVVRITCAATRTNVAWYSSYRGHDPVTPISISRFANDGLATVSLITIQAITVTIDGSLVIAADTLNNANNVTHTIGPFIEIDQQRSKDSTSFTADAMWADKFMETAGSTGPCYDQLSLAVSRAHLMFAISPPV